MKARLVRNNYLLIPAFTLLLMLMVGAVETCVAKCMTPSSPGEIEVEVKAAIVNLTTPTPIRCVARPNYPDEGWDHWNDPSFLSWDSGSSLNLTVVTAVVGLYRFPGAPWRTDTRNAYTMTYRDWWVWYLGSQIGEDPSTYPSGTFKEGFVAPPNRRNLRFFKGNELFSNTYDASVVLSVIAVRYWAYLNDDALLIRLSRDYLRANWAIYGMAAGYNKNSQAGPVWRYDLGKRLLANGTTTAVRTAVYPPQKPNNTQFDPTAPRRPNGNGFFYNGHFLALAGARSRLLGHWNSVERFTLFDRAIESVPSPLQSSEDDRQREIIELLEPKWSDLQTNPLPPGARRPPADENLYGLNRVNDIPKIKTLITTVSQSTVNSIMPYLMSYLTLIRTATPYRIMGWDGWRVSMMNTNTNGNNPNVYGLAYQAVDPLDTDPNQTHALATFLTPWTDAQQAGADGWCKLEPPTPGSAYARMHASNKTSDPINHPQRPGQPAKEVVMPIPASTPLFHLVLSPASQPYLDTSSPANWPPIEPPKSTTTFGSTETDPEGDQSWVFNDVPLGSVMGSDNEMWNWIDSNPTPYSDAFLLHQSSPVPGMHQHYFTGATETLAINTGDVLYAYVYLDPLNPPSEVMLQWLEPGTGWEHRAFWGADNYNSMGQLGTSSRRYMGPLPQPLGEWVRLEVPASLVGLEGRTLNGMAFSLFDGAATWDESGKNSPRSQLTNLAVGRSTTQSSTLNGASSQLAVDGRTDGNYFNNSVTHTGLDAQAWWQVDLGDSYSLNQINVWNRADCCSERLSNFYVFVSDVPFNSTDLTATRNQMGVSSYYVGGTALSPTIVSIGRRGRYVRVQLAGGNYLSLAEVEVIGQLISSQPPMAPSSDTVWIEDSIPAGATNISGGWNWIGSNPSPVSGTSSHQSSVISGGQQQFFSGATTTLTLSAGDKLFTYVYLDPLNPPTEIMLQWYEPEKLWEHRAYWGGNSIALGVDGMDSRRYMGALPPTGQWVRLEVPASQMGLGGRTLTGMAFTHWDGKVTWDRSGKSAQSWLPPPPPGDTVWVEDSVPTGAFATGELENWNWVSSNPVPASGATAHQSNLVAGTHQHYFTGATNTLTINTGDKLVAYVYLDPANPPSEIMLQWDEGTGAWAHRAYWGANSIGYGVDGQPSRYFMGGLPVAGQWVRLEVPASLVGLEGRTINGMAFTLYGGRATWDHAGLKRK